jgi:LacI family transcriptional regulator
MTTLPTKSADSAARRGSLTRGSSTRGSPTLVDVAREAGVSVSTAGRVLRDGSWPVDAELKERVLAAADRLSYVPNLMARTLRAGRPALVGLVVGNMLDPYYGEIAEAITRHAEASSTMLAMVCNMQRDPVLELKYCRQLWEHRVSGLILAGGGFDQITHHDKFVTILDQMTRNGVVVTTLSPRGIVAPVFSVDNEMVGKMAARELLEHGHRHIGIMVGRILNEVRKTRLHGMITAIREAGATCYVAEPEAEGEPDTSVDALLTKNPEITGIIASSNLISMGIIDGVRRTGRSVPDDISIVGIGNTRLAEWSMPKLTHVDLSLQACGHAALDFIAASVAGEPFDRNTIPPARLVRGGSVASLR